MHEAVPTEVGIVNDFDIAVFKIRKHEGFPDGFPTLQTAEYSDLHEMMEVATCGYPFGDFLWNQVGSVTSSFTKGTMSAILSEQKYGGSNPERVSIFMEDGHANLGDALKRIRYYQQDTDLPEWPPIVGDANFDSVEPVRLSSMRIGKTGSVSKLASGAAQAADLLAYLVGYVCSGHQTPVFAGVFDHLLSLQPVGSTGWGPASVKELVEALRQVAQTRKEQREGLYAVKTELRARGMKVYELPWGIVTDRSPGNDELSEQLRLQVNEILDKFKD